MTTPQIQFKSGQILFRTGKIAMDPDCCCGSMTCSMCNPETIASSVSLTVTATAKNPYPAECPDTDCNDLTLSRLNGTFALNHVEPCQYLYQHIYPRGLVCDYDQYFEYNVVLGLNIGGQVGLYVAITVQGLGDVDGFMPFTLPIDCNTGHYDVPVAEWNFDCFDAPATIHVDLNA